MASRIEDRMREEAIKQRVRSRQDDSDSEDENGGHESSGLGSDSYSVASTGATVSLINAKSLLYHYCSKLPSDS